MLDMVDAASNQLVWRGIAADSIPKKSEKVEKRIYKAVDKLLRHFRRNNDPGASGLTSGAPDG